MLFVCASLLVVAQQGQVEKNIHIVNDSLDILAVSPRDTIKTPPPVNKAFSSTKSMLDTTIIYSAKDSMYLDLKNKTMTLYGKGKMNYGPTSLEAHEIVIDYTQSTISAKEHFDSLTQKKEFPIYTEGDKKYETGSLLYNFESEKARITEAVTKEGEGFVHGNVVFKNEKNEIYTIGSSYTTCNLAKPHFRIISKRTKMISGDKIITGPFYMEVGNAPLPIGFPFGVFPLNAKRASGIIFPEYGEEGKRGFFFKRGGYFFDISDYMKLKITGDIYTKGSYALHVNFPYKKRYAFNGSFNFSLSNNFVSELIEEERRKIDYTLSWTHSPQTKRAGRFSASVNIATSTYTSNNLLDQTTSTSANQLNNTSRKLSSNISYSKTFRGLPFSLGINLSHNQDLVKNLITLTLPSISFNVNNIYPFKNISNNDFLEKLSIRYGMKLENRLTNNLGRINGSEEETILPFEFANIPTFFANSRRGMKHDASISSSLKVLRYFVFTPSFSYDEKWYLEKLNWGLNEDKSKVVVLDTLTQFNRVYNYKVSVSFTTRIYGNFITKNKKHTLRGIRHIINPTISYSYNPDFSTPNHDFFQTFTVKNRETKKSRHTGFVYGGGTSNETNALSFSVGNSLEMKVRNRKDSTIKKIYLLNSLSFSSSYNFAADSMRLSTISISANTNVLKGKLNISMNMTLDPYEYILTPEGKANKDGIFPELRTKRLVWDDKGRSFSLGRITRLNLSLGTNLSPKGLKRDRKVRNSITEANIPERTKQYLFDNATSYVDFDIPWNLRISYNLNYSRPISQREKITQALTFNGDISITKKWKISFNSGYDFEKKDFTPTKLNITRDLHCWSIGVNWVPFGKFQSYGFTIRAKSSILKDLKWERKRSFFDN